MSGNLKATIDVTDITGFVEQFKEMRAEVEELRAELAAAQEENARLRGRVDYLECALNGAESDTHKALSAFNELDAKWDAIPWDDISRCADDSFSGAPYAMAVFMWLDANAPKPEERHNG